MRPSDVCCTRMGTRLVALSEVVGVETVEVLVIVVVFVTVSVTVLASPYVWTEVVVVLVVVVVVVVSTCGLPIGVDGSGSRYCHSAGGRATHVSTRERPVAEERFVAVTIAWYTAARHPAVPSLA